MKKLNSIGCPYIVIVIDGITCSVDQRYWRNLTNEEFEIAKKRCRNKIIKDKSFICKRCEDVIYHPVMGNTCLTCDAPKDNLKDVIKCGIGRARIELGIDHE